MAPSVPFMIDRTRLNIPDMRTHIFIFMTVFLASTICMGQLTDNSRKRYLAVDISGSGLGIQYNQKPIGNRLGIGFRVGVTQVFAINKKFEIFLRLNYSQLGNRHFRVFPTGILDTINIYNSLKIYQEEVRLQYINTRIGLRKKILSGNSINVFAGINAFGGFLFNARYKGRELQGTSNYNSNSISTYYKINYGFEPELIALINLSNQNYFFITVSYEIGIPNIYKLNLIPIKGSFSSERTRALNLTLSFPISSHKQLQQ